MYHVQCVSVHKTLKLFIPSGCMVQFSIYLCSLVLLFVNNTVSQLSVKP